MRKTLKFVATAFTVAALLGCDIESFPSNATKPIEVQHGNSETWLSSRINSDEDIAFWRSKLQAAIFGAPGIPNSMPQKVEAITDDAFPGHDIDKITTITAGETSIAYLIHPEAPNGDLAIYHQGHGGDFRSLGASNIKNLLDEGYLVLAMNMPRIGLNNSGTSSHEGVPLRAFIEPVIASLNWVEKNYAPKRTIMIGLSGGGWTTVVTAAVDTRIDASFPVAGSWPCYLRETVDPDGSIGDYEQRQFCERSDLPTYLELYILGSYGRPQLQIFNYSDPCCFGGDHALQYEDFVRQHGGTFEVAIDRSHKQHAISDWAWSKIREALKNKR